MRKYLIKQRYHKIYNIRNLDILFKYSSGDVSSLPARSCPNRIDLIDKEGNVIETYKSVRVASSDLEIPYHSIYRVLRGEIKETKTGYLFKINSNEFD